MAGLLEDSGLAKSFHNGEGSLKIRDQFGGLNVASIITVS